MTDPRAAALGKFRRKLHEDYAKRFPASRRHFEHCAGSVLDGASHGIRWNDPFMPVVRRAAGAVVEDLDGHRIVDYWQGHFANILGHNPPLLCDALIGALADGRGLQSGMLHEVEAQLAELLCHRTGSETVRLTTSGSLGTLYATLLARAFTGRDRVLKVAGGWHGSQPFGLKGVSPHGSSFDHVESEGLPEATSSEILLTRFNDPDDLRGRFERDGDRIACFLVEPVLGQGGGIAARAEYLREARRLTAKHGALLICDEIITGFRFRAGDLTSLYEIRPDLLVLGKVIGGGMPVAAVAGRRDVMTLCSREIGRVKFEGGTYSAHELSLVAALTLLDHLIENEEEIYAALAAKGERLRAGMARAAAEQGVHVCTMGTPEQIRPHGSLVMLHVLDERAEAPQSPERLVEVSHPFIDDRLLKSSMLLEDVSTRSGLGAVSTAHDPTHLDRTVDAFRAVLSGLQRAGLV